MIENSITFLILCPELNYGGLRSTVSSVKSNFAKSNIICMVGTNANAEDMREIGRLCPVIKAGNTITSLINSGVKKIKTEWCFLIMSGCMTRNTMLRKYNAFLKNEKEILYSVVDKSTWLFPDSTINGMLLNKQIIKEVGDFPDDEENIVNSKLVWSSKALEKGYKFKGIVGTKL
jgi:hypothetical protein